MPPPPPPKRIKRPATVLDEDIYTNALSEIIARDFFPGLLETQLKQEYLDALESGDKEWIARSRGKLADAVSGRPSSEKRARGGDATPQQQPGRPGETPTGWGGETPVSVGPSEATATTPGTGQRGEIPDVSNMGLLAFQGKYTSEDNESFNKVLDKQNAKRRDQYRWLWSGNKIPSARQIAHHRREEKRIMERGENPNGNSPQHGAQEEKQVAIKTDLDARPAKPDAWGSARAENSLMFVPSSIEDTHETIQQKREAQSRAAPKRVLYQNTRLQDPGAAEAAGDNVPPSPSVSAIQDAIAGRPRVSESEAGYTGGETPRVNGYAFVDEDEPEPEPTQDASASADDDLRLLGPSSSTPNPFQIRDNRQREDLHHRMVDRVARKKRAEKTGANQTKSPVIPRFSSSPRLDFGLRTPAGSSTPTGGGRKSLTPAAQNLLQRVGSTPKASGGSSGLRNMWTPTPKRR